MSVKIIDYKDVGKGALQGTCTVLTVLESWPVEIRGVTIFQKGKQRWANMPNRPFEKDGEKMYYNLVLIPDKAHMSEFSLQVIAALDDFLSVQSVLPVEQPSFTNGPGSQGCPF